MPERHQALTVPPVAQVSQSSARQSRMRFSKAVGNPVTLARAQTAAGAHMPAFSVLLVVLMLFRQYAPAAILSRLLQQHRQQARQAAGARAVLRVCQRWRYGAQQARNKERAHQLSAWRASGGDMAGKPAWGAFGRAVTLCAVGKAKRRASARATGLAGRLQEQPASGPPNPPRLPPADSDKVDE